MAATPEIFARSEFRLAIKPETTVGTENTTTMQLVNIDSDITVNDNPAISSEMRAKVGRTKKLADYFVTEEGQVKSITFS